MPMLSIPYDFRIEKELTRGTVAGWPSLGQSRMLDRKQQPFLYRSSAMRNSTTLFVGLDVHKDSLSVAQIPACSMG